MHNRMDPNYPYLENPVNEKNFFEKYGSVIIALITIIGSAMAVYTSIVTKMEITTLKQKYMEQKIITIDAQVKLNTKTINLRDRHVQGQIQELNNTIKDLDSSNSRSLSEIYDKLNRMNNK